MSIQQLRTDRQHRNVVLVGDGGAAGASPAASPRWAPPVPQPRGAVSEWLTTVLTRPPGTGSVSEAQLRRWVESVPGDSATDEDLQLALYCVYGLSFRGFADVHDGWEWDRDLLAVRIALEARFEADLREAVDRSGAVRGRSSVAAVLAGGRGPSLSRHMAEHGTLDELVEFCVHRSAYQLKEADAHTFGIPRLEGARKAAFVEIQADEYGNGRPGRSHSELFGRVLDSLGVDSRFGAHIDLLPATTLATDNLVTLLGSHRRLRSALLGHLAGFEMTSVEPMSRYAAAARRLGLGPEVSGFYDVHVDADAHHGRLAEDSLVGGDLEGDGLSPEDVRFGAAALMLVEDRFARALLGAWAAGASSFRGSEGSDRPSPSQERRFDHVA